VINILTLENKILRKEVEMLKKRTKNLELNGFTYTGVSENRLKTAEIPIRDGID
jgi:hypothetical protein